MLFLVPCLSSSAIDAKPKDCIDSLKYQGINGFFPYWINAMQEEGNKLIFGQTIDNEAFKPILSMIPRENSTDWFGIILGETRGGDFEEHFTAHIEIRGNQDEDRVFDFINSSFVSGQIICN